MGSSYNLSGLAQRTYQKTDIFDAAGNHTWNHPLPGQNIEVFVELYGGGGGSQETSGAATDGGDSIWDTAGTNDTADGGSGADIGNQATTGLNGKGLYNAGGELGGDYGILLTNGSNHYGAVLGGGTDYFGNVGDVKRFNVIANGDINLTVGAGGTGNAGNGNSGAVVVSYNITATTSPVTVNLQRRDWEHFGEVSWRTAANTAVQSVPANTLTDLTLDTEVLDTGNKVSVSANQMTLEAGTYEFDIDIPIEASEAGDVCIRLYNVTDSSLVTSFTEAQRGDGGAGLKSNLKGSGFFTLPTQKILKLEAIFSATTGSRLVGGGTNLSTLTDLTDRTKFQFKWRP